MWTQPTIAILEKFHPSIKLSSQPENNYKSLKLVATNSIILKVQNPERRNEQVNVIHLTMITSGNAKRMDRTTKHVVYTNWITVYTRLYYFLWQQSVNNILWLFRTLPTNGVNLIGTKQHYTTHNVYKAASIFYGANQRKPHHRCAIFAIHSTPWKQVKTVGCERTAHTETHKFVQIKLCVFGYVVMCTAVSRTSCCEKLFFRLAYGLGFSWSCFRAYCSVL